MVSGHQGINSYIPQDPLVRVSRSKLCIMLNRAIHCECGAQKAEWNKSLFSTQNNISYDSPPPLSGSVYLNVAFIINL